MSIRDEVKKLPSIEREETGLPSYWINRDDVLSILDEKWELVAEITGEDWLCPPSPDPLDQIDIMPGDEVAIYKRRGKEDVRPSP